MAHHSEAQPMIVPATAERIRPSGWWIGLSILLFFLAVASCAAVADLGAWRAFDVDTHFSRTSISDLEAGDYTVYLSNPNARVTITAPDGSRLDLVPYDGDTTLTREVEYEATYTFNAPVDGEYSVVREGDGQVAIGEGLGTPSDLIGSGLAIGFIGAVVACVMFIVTLVKRASSHDQIVARQYAAAGWSNAHLTPRPPPRPLPPPPAHPPPQLWRP